MIKKQIVKLKILVSELQRLNILINLIDEKYIIQNFSFNESQLENLSKFKKEKKQIQKKINKQIQKL